ncbi:MerR family transcriptional regulator [Sphingomonas melonis]
MVSRTDKARGAFRTIGEVSAETGLAHHILRYWETRFPQLRPVTRAGNRRYYRPEDVALVRRIDTLLNQQGYTIRGVQQLLADADRAPPPAPAEGQADLTAMLLAIRNRIADALRQDDVLKPR